MNYPPRDRKATMYLAVLGTALLVSLMTAAGLGVARVRNRALLSGNDTIEARRYAFSAIQIGLLKIKQNSAWRTTYTSGVWESNRAIGGGSYTLEGVDPVDGNLANSSQNPLVLTATAVKGNARQKLRVTVVQSSTPLPVLNYGLAASGGITVNGGKSIRVDNLPLSSNGVIDNNGTIYANVECQSFNHTGTITGSATVGAAAKSMPDAGVFAMYQSMATSINNPGTIDRQVLGPTRNNLNGITNADGVYFIDATNGDLTIKRSRINGTLLVKLGNGRNLTITDAVLIHNYRPDFPTLLVDGGTVNIQMDSASKDLSELSIGTNFNPSNAPYNGNSNFTLVDTYPNEIQGLVHIRGTLQFHQTGRVNGVVICEGTVTCKDTNQVIGVPGIYRNPPLGYAVGGEMVVLPGKWEQVVD
jgi:hypothetical protein